MHWVSGKHVTCCDFAKVFHLYIVQFLKYRQTQVSSICQVFVSLSHSLLALLCVASICFKRACLIICCIAPPNTPLQNLLPERLQYGLVCCWLPSLERSQQFLVKLFCSMSCPYKMTGPFRNLTKWVAVLIFLLHMLQKVWPPDCAEYICEHLYIFCSPIVPLQSERSPSKQL